MNMWDQTYEVDSESAIYTMCGTRLNTQLDYKMHDYFKYRTAYDKYNNEIW
jgi:hypothetical protein